MEKSHGSSFYVAADATSKEYKLTTVALGSAYRRPYEDNLIKVASLFITFGCLFVFSWKIWNVGETGLQMAFCILRVAGNILHVQFSPHSVDKENHGMG